MQPTPVEPSTLYYNTAPSLFPPSVSAQKSFLETQSGTVKANGRKRFFDIAFSLFVILFVMSWLFPIIAFLIKMTSRGPVLFIQERIGLDGRTFRCFKFRTMKVTSVRYMYTPTDGKDARVTFIGSILRATSLDELPQFFNVLIGDMSVVGPRPHAIAFHKTYASFVDYIENRHLVKPGITGLAQIKGYRGDVKNFEENMLRTKKRIAIDILYIKVWTFKTDLWIVYTTFLQVFRLKGYDI